MKKFSGCTILILLALLPRISLAQNVRLPFNGSNPVFYDNDDHRDMYTDEFLLALASAGTIQLKGFVTTYSADSVEYELFVAGRQAIIDAAAASGFRHLPKATAGPRTALVRPRSNRIADTKPLHSAGAKALVAAALQASAAKPLVVIAGGQLTAIADAYLINPAIANRVIVSGIFGALHKTYNAGLDVWAWAIVLSRFRCLSISDSDTSTAYNQVFKTAMPFTPKARFANELKDGRLPQTPLYKWMLEKRHPRHPAAYMERDGDGGAVVPLLRADYITQLERWRCVGLDKAGWPMLTRDKNGPLYLAIKADETIATAAFWQALLNPSSWSDKAVHRN